MAKDNETSFELDVEETPKPEKIPLEKNNPPLRKISPKKKVHHVSKISKKVSQKESQKKEPEPPEAPQPASQQPATILETQTVQKNEIKLPAVKHTTTVVQHSKENNNFAGIKVDPVVAAVVGTAAAVAGTAAVASGVATPVITAVKAGIIKIKAALGISTKAAVVAGGAAAAGAALLVLEKKFTDYEKDIQVAKEDVGDIGEQLKKLDKLLDSVKK